MSGIVPRILEISSHDPVSVLSDARNFVRKWLSSNGAQFNERGDVVNSLAKNRQQILEEMFLDYETLVKSYNTEQRGLPREERVPIKPINEKLLTYAFGEVCYQVQHAIKQEMIDSIACTQENLEPLKQFIAAIIGPNASFDNTVAVFAHWIWCIKRNMKNLHISYHIMPVLYSKEHGSGKSESLKYLLKHINAYRLNVALTQIVDARIAKSMSENFVCVLDEMAGAARTDLESLKKKITEDYTDARVLGTHQVIKLKQACCFIGTSNKPVSEMVFDTGMRRFYQVNCPEKLNWAELARINYLELWKGIDDSRENGYILDRMEEIKLEQAAMATEEEIDTFLKALNIKPGTTEVKTQDLFDMYRNWCIDNGFKPYNSSWMGRKLSNRRIDKVQKNDIDGTSTRYYLINSDYVKYNSASQH